MSEWIEKRIGDIVEVVAGGTPNTTVAEYWDGDVSWITPNDLSHYKERYISYGERSITKTGLAKSAAKLLPRNTVLLTTRAPIGYLAIAEREVSTNQGFKNLICNDTQVDYRFLYYYIKLNVEYFKAFASGATFPELSGGALKRVKVYFPDLPTQTRIADILSAYDDAIENNNRRITLLEKAARELYREWFVRFRFPGHENSRFVNGLPERWKVRRVGDVVRLQRGHDLPIASVNRGEYPVIGSSGIIAYHEKSTTKPPVIVLGRSGSIGNPRYYECECWIHNTAIYSKVIYGEPLWVFYMLSQIDYSQLVGGSAVPTLNRNHVESRKVLTPDKELQKEFGIFIKSLFLEIVNIHSQSQNLSRQRDLLLPRLMSGKLEV